MNEMENLVGSSKQNKGRKFLEKTDETMEINNNKFPQSDILVPYKTNILQHINGILYDASFRISYHESQVRKLATQSFFEKLQLTDHSSRFQRRITEISWHPKEPFLVGAGCKGGDLLVLKGINSDCDFKFNQQLALKGPGPGCSILAIRFEENRRHLMYTAGLEGVVNSYDIENGGKRVHQFYNTNNFDHWFTSMDVSQATRTLLAGCTKGKVYLSTLDGDKVTEVKLHKGKVLHCEFNQSIPHLIVTSSIDKTAKLWDLRKLSEMTPIHSFEHNSPVNVAHFNPLNCSRLLTSDQKEEIRVYQGPSWMQTMVIKHPHRQFQHLTPVVANWYQPSNMIVIGKYPVVPKGAPAPPRPIQFFDSDTGCLVNELYPPSNLISSLNIFNPTGEVLATAQGVSLLFFNAQDQSNVLKKKSDAVKQKFAGRNGMRFDGRRAGERGDSSDSDDENNDNTQRRKKTKTSRPTAAPTKQKAYAAKTTRKSSK